jgi:hypothetical protein
MKYSMPTTSTIGSKHTGAVLTAVACFLLCPGSSFAQSGSSITLNSRATILVDAQQPVPVQLAAKDLASDMQKVFGTAPKIVTSEDQAGPVSIVLADEAAGAPADHVSAPEAFSITSGSATLGNGHSTQVIRLAGSDMRGTLYAIYQFSQQYLGVDPMYY